MFSTIERFFKYICKWFYVKSALFTLLRTLFALAWISLFPVRRFWTTGLNSFKYTLAAGFETFNVAAISTNCKTNICICSIDTGLLSSSQIWLNWIYFWFLLLFLTGSFPVPFHLPSSSFRNLLINTTVSINIKSQRRVNKEYISGTTRLLWSE